MPDNKVSTIYFPLDKKIYLNPTLACQTKANKKNKIGIIGITSANGPKIANAPGNLLKKRLSIRRRKI